MLDQLQSFIKKHQLLASDDDLLLAVSGGKDSVAMAHLFHQLGYKFALAHCNFKLRNEDSDLDEAFVKELAHQFNVPFYVQTFETNTYAKENRISIQMAARDLRYQWFNSICRDRGFDKILTAHHLDDSIETLLIKKSRKASVGALQGIPLRNANTIRPMLCFSVTEIQNYLAENAIQYREDKSNASTYYQRNSIRKELQLDGQNDREYYLKEIEQNKRRYSNLLEKCANYKSNHCTERDGGTLLNFEYLLEQDEKQEILYECLKFYGPFSWADVFSLLYSEVGRQVSNSEYRIIRERDGLHLSKMPSLTKEKIWISEGHTQISIPIHIKFSVHNAKEFKLIKNKHFAALDYDQLSFPLVIRRWQKGDAFVPLGMQGTKKISDFMIDEKFSTSQKENTWVICSLDRIVCVLGHRINDNFKLVPHTEKVYLVQPLKMEHGK